MLDSIYHMTLKLPKIAFFGHVNVKILPSLAQRLRNVTKSVNHYMEAFH